MALMLSGPCCCKSFSICPAGDLSTSCMSDNITVLSNPNSDGKEYSTQHIFVNFSCQKYAKYLMPWSETPGEAFNAPTRRSSFRLLEMAWPNCMLVLHH